MRFSEAWLREGVNPDIDTTELVEQLTMAGLEVDGVEPAAGDFEGIVVGEVLEVNPHPNADRLRVCKVEIGTGEPLSIVCGAPNVHVGMRVPSALIGAVLPGDFRIKKSKLRGCESHGMLCSEKELGLTEEADGLMQLPVDAPVGSDLRVYLKLDDAILDVDLTPNRADCLSIEGVAREVALLNRLDWKVPELKQNPLDHQTSVPVRVEESEACPRYLARLIKGVDPGAKTPIWMQERLRRSGLRSLGPLVDVTNFLLIELGQPLHAFDSDRISGGIVVRFAAPGEKLSLLNGQDISLDPDLLVIADHSRPLALAGIMGGQGSAVSQGTENILLECAFFSPAVIRGKSRRYGLHTDSSHRFERGVDPALQRRAIERATELITSIAGGQIGPIVEVKTEAALPIRESILLRRDRIKRVLGIEFNNSEVEDIFRRLGMPIEANPEGWRVTSPSFRFDISIEADLIEELGRVYGYDRLPLSRLLMHVELAKDSEAILSMDRFKDILVDRGYQEAITFSFVDEAILGKITPDEKPCRLENPISSELSMMRTSLWPGLILAAQRNINRQLERIRLFESGLVFLNRDTGIAQKQKIAGLVTGSIYTQQWVEKPRLVDFYDAKSDVEVLLALTGEKCEYLVGVHSALHPGRTAVIEMPGGVELGWVGMLHPGLQKEFGFDQPVFLFELDFEWALKRRIPTFKELSKFPHVRRDLAVIVKESVSARDLLDCIASLNEKIVYDVVIFDVYRGRGVESGSKSIALGLMMRDYEGTLTDSKIDAIVSKVLNQLYNVLDAKLRD